MVYGFHSWDEGTVTTEPTSKEEGVKTYCCLLCGKQKNQKIEKTQSSILKPWGSNASDTNSTDTKRGCFGNLFGGCKSMFTGGAGLTFVISLAGVSLLAKKKKD